MRRRCFCRRREGDAGASVEVGERYLEGNGGVKNAGWAARWYARAAEAGHVPAQCRLAALHLSGVPRAAVEPDAGLFDTADWGRPDHAAAMIWARHAAEAGSAEAQAMLAFILSSGPEDLRDPDAAFSCTANPPRGIARKAGWVTQPPWRGGPEARKRGSPRIANSFWQRKLGCPRRITCSVWRRSVGLALP